MPEERDRSAAAQMAALNMDFGMAFPPIPPSGTRECPKGIIRLGMFFDGTDNNGWRDWGKGFSDWKPGRNNDPVNAEDGSPEKARAVPGKTKGYDKLNGPTNVAKLYFLFKEEGCCQRRVYTTGVGGGDRNTPIDSMKVIEAMTGRGGRARIDWGIAWLTEFVNEGAHHLAVEKRVDTFGFSRGATQARDFVNKAIKARIEDMSQPSNDHRFIPVGPYIQGDPMAPPTRSYVRVKTYPEMRGIMHEYLGIMDTVASEGIGVVFSAGNSWVGYELGVKGRPKDEKLTPEKVLKTPPTVENVVAKEGWVHRTFHQVADDEFRDVFALEVIGLDPKITQGSQPYKHLPKNMREQGYPGCHADVGGGYRNSTNKVPGPLVEKTYPMRYGEFYTRMEPSEIEVPMLINIATLTLHHMVEDANGVAVISKKVNDPSGSPKLFHDPGELPDDLGVIDACADVPSLTGLYEEYCKTRLALIKKYAPNYPLFADWTHETDKGLQASCYLQSYPDDVYQNITRDMRATDCYKKLLRHYIHLSEDAGVYKYLANPARRLLRALFDSRDGNSTLTSRRQRDVHYYGRQNSYDHPNCPNK